MPAPQEFKSFSILFIWQSAVYLWNQGSRQEGWLDGVKFFKLTIQGKKIKHLSVFSIMKDSCVHRSSILSRTENSYLIAKFPLPNSGEFSNN